MAAAELNVVHLGVVEYREALALQERLRDARVAGAVPDTLLLLEHPPVFTRGKRPDPNGLAFPPDFYAQRGIDVVETRRGGKVTYHGPGQLVGYAIMATSDVKEFVRAMERALVAALADEGITARLRPDEGADFTGVWVEDRKIASIGLNVSRGVTLHGFAVNVTNDLAPFGWAVACGLPDVQMTSIEQELGKAGLACFRKRAAHRFAEAHGRRQRLVTPHRLHASLDAVPA